MQNPVAICIDDTNSPPNSAAVSAANPLPAGGNVAAGATDAGNPVKIGGKYNSTLPTLTDGQRGDIQLDANAGLRAVMTAPQTAASDAWPNANIAYIRDSTSQAVRAILSIAPHIFNGTTWDRESKATATSRIVSAAANTNPTSAKAAAGTVYSIDCQNTSAATKYLKLYNKATAPTVGTDTPVRTIALPPSNARTLVTFPTGLFFATGIAYGLSGAAADGDSTALAAGDVVGLNIDYS